MSTPAVGKSQRWELDIADLVNAGEAAKAVFRRIHWTDPTGAKWRASALVTAKVSDATDDGHSDTSNDLYFGGSGGGGTIMCKITADPTTSGDYIVVKRWDGSAVTGSEFNVAKVEWTRTSITSETVDGVGLTYIYSDANRRSTTDGPNTVLEVCYRRYVLNGFIWAVVCDHSGVTVSGSELLFIESNNPVRAWARQYAT